MTLILHIPNKIFGAAFGPGLTMETFIAVNSESMRGIG